MPSDKDSRVKRLIAIADEALAIAADWNRHAKEGSVSSTGFGKLSDKERIERLKAEVQELKDA